MNVPFLDLKRYYQAYQEEYDEAYFRVMNSGWVISGPECDAFEAEYAQLLDVDHCVGVGNGYDALYCILRALDIGDGDEVIVPASTFIATFLAVSAVGATPVVADIDEIDYTIDLNAVKNLIRSKTKAVIPVHLYGHPARMAELEELTPPSIHILEDAAQAHGALERGRACGAMGFAAGFSFYPVKNVGALGDGGAITTNDRSFAEKVRQFRNYGSVDKYHHLFKGNNSRLDELQAAFLRVKLRHLPTWNGIRNRFADRYTERLQQFAPDLVLPTERSGCAHVWHQYVVRTDQRDELQRYLADHDVQTLIHYPIPPHKQRAYAELNSLNCPIGEKLAAQCLSLPIDPLHSDEEIEQTASVIEGFFKEWDSQRKLASPFVPQ